ncbi:polymerase [Mesorhizobium sp. B283B1A]|uniref:polymerase n=1 Tax=Mesorhizobium TaxID=68287 RepID=UPI001CD0BA1D|nr:MULTISPECIES: polymerase [Mesorhizobium]MCA0050200.1 polymerase [Mesorhizobium sp. B283B1A]UQS66458.1 polymerase [Mesorhizobium opportunistum]
MSPFVVSLVTNTRRIGGGCSFATERAMQIGEIIANLLAAVLLICVIAVIFLVAGKPLWPIREAKMVIVLPPDAIATASISAPTHPPLPDRVDTRIVQPRPRQH